MVESLLQFLRGLPPEWTTLIIAALPVVEVRGAIPVALELFDMPPIKGITLAFIGSAIPAAILPAILEPLEKPFRRTFKWGDRLFVWIINHVQKRYTTKYRALGSIGLIVFLSIPLPVTGVWTGSLAAWLFRIPKKYAILSIIVGTAISSLIVTATTITGFAALRWIL